MKIFDRTKTAELDGFPDPDKGQLLPDTITVRHDAVPARTVKTALQAAEELTAAGETVFALGGRYFRVVKVYPNGGRDVEEIKAVTEPGKEAWDEEEDILVYVPYTEREIAEREIATLKAKLAQTDYLAIKYAEGELSAEEYGPAGRSRKEWRARINELEQNTEADP